MANDFSRVSVGITAHTGGLSTGLRNATRQLTAFGRINQRLSAMSLSVNFLAAQNAIFMTAYALRRVSSAMNNAVQSSASLTEAQNRVDVIFGKSAESVKRFSEITTTSLGISKRDALDAAGLFGTLFTNIGLTEQQSANMSNALVKLSSDMASFNDKTIEESLRAIRSALVGEVEPIRRLGIVLNDNALRQEAFAMGLTKTTRFVLTPAVKMVAAYSSIVKQAGRQHGDFTRTQHELSNQQRILSANFEDFIGLIGDDLKPAFLTVVSGINDSMPSIRAFFATIKDLFKEMFAGFSTGITFADGFRFALRGIVAYLTIARGTFQLVTGAVYQFAAATQTLASSFYGSLGALVEGFVNIALTSISLITIPLQKLISLIAEGLRLLDQKKIADELGAAVQKLRDLPSAAQGIGDALKNKFGLDEISSQARRNAEDLGATAAEHFADGLKKLKDPLGGFDANLLRENMKLAANAALAVIPGIGNAVGNAIKAAVGEAKASVESLKAITVDSAAGEEFRNAMLRGADPRLSSDVDKRIADNTGRTADAIANLPNAIVGKLGQQFAVASVTV